MSVALMRPSAVRKLVGLLRPLPARERAVILAQAAHEGARIGADQVLIALALGRQRPVDDMRSAMQATSLTNR